MHESVLAKESVSYALIVEAKKNGAPRFVRSAIHHLKSYLAHMHQFVHEHVGSPFDSDDCQSLLCLPSRGLSASNHNVAYLDLFGNAHLSFRECVFRANRRREAEI